MQRFNIRMKSVYLKSLLLCVVSLLSVAAAEPPAAATPLSYQRIENPFETPSRLRPRVDFWKDIFAKYGKNQMVIHHRDFPQVRFGVIDLSLEAALLNPVLVEKAKKRAAKVRVDEVKDAMKALATGAEPQNDFQKMIEEAMKGVPGGLEKYQKAIDDDLIRTQTGIREKFGESLRRAGRYLRIMEDIFVNEFGLPAELTRLPFVESSFDYTAYSSVGAAGIWQFMPRTARLYMKVNSYIDERRDPIESTRAAAMYLRGAYATLGTWPLALTSYNHGVGGVLKKTQKFGTRDLAALIEHPTERVFGFASSNFYPEFLAALEISRSYRTHFPEIKLEPPLRVVQFRLPRAISIQHIAKQLELELDDLRACNYALSENIWKGRYKVPADYVLKVPQQSAQLVARLNIPSVAEQPVGPPASSVYGGITYKVRKGDSLQSIAKKYKTDVAQLREINNLDSDNLKAGQVLQVRTKKVPGPNDAITVVKEKVVAKGEVHQVQKGETLSTISKKYGISLKELKSRNKLKSNKLKIGQRLIVG